MKTGVPVQDLLHKLAHGQPISGEALASELGVTRAAIWKQVAVLRALGVPVAARPGTGYQIPWPLELLDGDQIARALGPAAAPVHVHWQLESTQNELARIAGDAPDLSVIMSENQTTGRGRRGREWYCPPGMGIMLSLLKRFEQGPAFLSGLSIAMGVCTVQALAGADPTGSMRIKWPNDVVTTQGKLAGILIEVDGEYEGPCLARIGLGLNLRLTPELLEQLQQPASDTHKQSRAQASNTNSKLLQAATDLYSLTKDRLPGRNLLAVQLIEHLRDGLLLFEREGLAAFADSYSRLDCLAGQKLVVHGAEGEMQGVGCGIDPDGALRVQVNDKVIRVISDKVSVRS